MNVSGSLDVQREKEGGHTFSFFSSLDSMSSMAMPRAIVFKFPMTAPLSCSNLFHLEEAEVKLRPSPTMTRAERWTERQEKEVAESGWWGAESAEGREKMWGEHGRLADL